MHFSQNMCTISFRTLSNVQINPLRFSKSVLMRYEGREKEAIKGERKVRKGRGLRVSLHEFKIDKEGK